MTFCITGLLGAFNKLLCIINLHRRKEYEAFLKHICSRSLFASHPAVHDQHFEPPNSHPRSTIGSTAVLTILSVCEVLTLLVSLPAKGGHDHVIHCWPRGHQGRSAWRIWVVFCPDKGIYEPFQLPPFLLLVCWWGDAIWSCDSLVVLKHGTNPLMVYPLEVVSLESGRLTTASTTEDRRSDGCMPSTAGTAALES